MDVPESGDRSPEFGSPIPYKNIYKPSASSSEAEKELQTGLFKKMFLSINPNLVFSGDFYENAAAVMDKYGLGEDYCRWLYRECLKMEPGNLRGLYYTLFRKPEMTELYFSCRRKNDEINIKPDILCPVCGKVFESGLEYCPYCMMSVSEMNNETEIERHKRYSVLSEEQKNNYANELSDIFRLLGTVPALEYQAMAREIDERYGLAAAAGREAG
jgi:hypothetical protein